MNSFRPQGAALVLPLVLAVFLVGCHRPDPMAVPRGEPNAASAKRATVEAKRDSRDTRSSAAPVAKGAPDKAPSASAHAESTRTMGAGAEKIDDTAITAKVNASLAKDKDLHAMRIDVDTQDGVVTLSGLAPSASAKEQASEIAHKVPGVRSVNNQLTIRSS
jgi:osmotically-inducible protein OsmY